MYVDICKYKRGNKTYKRVLLREGYREGGKVKHRTLANLSHCSDEEIEAIRIALKGKKQIVVIGLLTDEQGEPISIEGFCGNTTSQCNPATGITLSGDTCCHEKETE